ncbi:MAG: di-trans,poly-cis-decaprenylcistransferase [Gammaproteobacteria bacterium]|jgi:undecaprenyl diphosphate synthase|nr:di-trans,poly-cis-decaprenylcistransferase [Gammaproteobacteria bacterium]
MIALPEPDQDGTQFRVPAHVAIIMDGNGRWARQRGLPRTQGHRAGAKSVRAVVEQGLRSGVEVLTLFAFSSENWRRPRSEVNTLLELFMNTLKVEVKRLVEHDVRLRFIGELSAFSHRLQRQMAEAEAATQDGKALLLQIAANYGGRWDVVQSVQSLSRDVAEGRLRPEDIDETAIASRLCTGGFPEPDLFIRTGGEKRVSNFLLWQCAYAELYFSDLMWPEFDADAFVAALKDFGRRQRRFGRTGEQITELAEVYGG